MAEEETAKVTKLDTAKRRWKLVCDVWGPQIDREREDLKFKVPANQWTDEARKERKGGSGLPGRPTLSITKIDQPLRLVMNQLRAARLGVDISPVSEEANSDTAEAIQGLYRNIERDSRADLARTWGAKRALEAGRGTWRVLTEYDPTGGHPLDQKIVIKRLLHQENWFPDPSAQESDFSDGRFGFYVAWVAKEDFQGLYPEATKYPSDKLEWEAATHESPEWVREDDVLVAEYWYKEHHTEPIMVRGKARGKKEWDTVHRCMMTGWETFEEIDWPGQHIPFIHVVGEELIPFDEERIWVGMIGPAKDGQRLYNYAASTLVERMAMEPKAPFMGFVGQFNTDQEKWKQINTRNFPYVEADLINVDGKPVPLPQRAQLDQTGMSLAMMALQEADNFLQATTGVNDWSKGRADRNESGKKVLALQNQTDEGTSHYQMNVAEAVAYEATVVLDLIPHIYDRPGRVARILRGDDDKSEAVILNAPFAMDPNTGRPVRVKGQTEGVKEYNLRDGVYSVAVKVGKSFQTRLEQGAQFMGDMLTAMPEYLPLIGDLFFRFRDDPGAKEIADRLTKLREQKFPGLGEGEDGTMDPKQAQAKLQAMELQMKELEGSLQQAVQQLEADAAKEQAKQQGALAKAKMDNEAKVQIASMGMQEAAQKDALTMALEKMNDQAEAQQKELDRRLEVWLAKFEAAHEVAMAAAGGNTMTRTREGGQEQGQEQESEQSHGASQEQSEEQSTGPEGE